MIKKKSKFKLSLFFLIICISVISTGCSNESKKSDTTEPIFDASIYSGISKSDLFSKLGEANKIQKWNSKTTRGTFPVTTYSYEDKENNHYEFIIPDESDSVVRVTVYSSKYWTGEGENLEYKELSIDKMLEILNIKPNNSTKVQADTGFAYRINPVNDNIKEVWFLDIEKEASNFGMVKITYNSNYLQ